MTQRPINLGPFVLDAVVGRGSSGVVWRAHHRSEPVDVAIKVITPEAALDPAGQADLRREVRAAAGLDHPNIVAVLDQGTIPAEVADASDDELVSGSPWVAMEYAVRGSLRDAGPPPDWRVVRRVVLDVLDGLAHAHAHGVVHRDIEAHPCSAPTSRRARSDIAMNQALGPSTNASA